MDWIIPVNIFFSLVLLIVLLLETVQYGRVLQAVKRIDDAEESFNRTIIELSEIVNNNAEMLKAQVQTLADHQVSISNLEMFTDIHGEILKLYAIANKFEKG